MFMACNNLKFRQGEAGEGVSGLAAFAEATSSRHPDPKFAGWPSSTVAADMSSST